MPEDIEHLIFGGVRVEKDFILDCVTEMASKGTFSRKLIQSCSSECVWSLE